MSEQLVEMLLVVLALLGGAALVMRLLRTGFRLALSAAEETAASELAGVSQRRGDLTSMAERRAHQETARARRRRELSLAAVWLLWLAIPPMAGWLPLGYAPAAALWLLPRRRVRRGPPVRAG